MPQSLECMSLSSVSGASEASNCYFQPQPKQGPHEQNEDGHVSPSSQAFSDITRSSFESISDDRAIVTRQESDCGDLSLPSTEARQNLSVPEPVEDGIESCTNPNHKWGTTPGGEPVVPKITAVFEPSLNPLKRGKSTLSHYCVSVITNTMRYQVQQFSRIVRACQKNPHQMSHGLVDDIYVYLNLALDCERDCIDTIMNTVIPFAEDLSSMKGSLKLKERTTLCEWSRRAEIEMRRSQSKFKRNLPAGEQVGYLVHAALGFQFMLDIASLADRFLPGHMEAASTEVLRKLSRDVSRSLISSSKPGVDCSVRVWTIGGWMSHGERRSFRQSATRIFRRDSLSLAAIRHAQSNAREFNDFPMEVEKSLSSCEKVQARDSLMIALLLSVRGRFSCTRVHNDEEASEPISNRSVRTGYGSSETWGPHDVRRGEASEVLTSSEENSSGAIYTVESVYDLDGWANTYSR